MIVSRLMAAAVLLSLTSFASAQEESSTDPRVLVYLDEVGGPYFDEWYLQGDTVRLEGLTLQRSGKSGELSVPVAVNCNAATVSVSGAGLVFESMDISAGEAQEYIIAPIADAVIQKVCP
ncbi:MAG: hypothetical protein LRY66_00620 [Saccharospirillaceae bacterium]|nr:hypothetical protein [Saccharospirillaceae bacterium]MCD8529877.1 hypothetical protein [Saccharospirillaceae bacterium]